MTEIVLQVFGVTNLEKAARDEDLRDEGDLQRKLLTIYGNSAQLAGLDLFKENQPPAENLLILVYFLRSLANRTKDIKRDKFLSEVAAIENYLRRINDVFFERMISGTYLAPKAIPLTELTQILDSHLDEIIERKHSHVRNVVSFMEYFIVHDFDALCKTFSSEMSINKTEYKERLQELFLIYQALSSEAKEVLKVATVFHDIGSIKGERDWMHNQVGAHRIKTVLRELNYTEIFIGKVSKIILYHGFYANMGVDYLPKDFSDLTDEEKDILLLIGVFDCSARAKGNILVPWKMKELISLRNTRIKDFIKNKDFYKHRFQNLLMPVVFTDLAQRSKDLEEIIKFLNNKGYLTDSFTNLWNNSMRIYAFTLFQGIGKTSYEDFVKLVKIISDAAVLFKERNLGLDDLIIDTDLDFMSMSNEEREPYFIYMRKLLSSMPDRIDADLIRKSLEESNYTKLLGLPIHLELEERQLIIDLRMFGMKATNLKGLRALKDARDEL